MRYFHASLKGSAEIDWSDPEAREGLLTEIAADARRLLKAAGTTLGSVPEKAKPAIWEAAQLLEQLLLQDVVETPGPDGGTQARIRRGTTPGRLPSATDPEQRHGHKSKNNLFTGHKASVATDIPSKVIVDVEVLPGNAGDAEEALAQTERVEENTGQPVAATTGDCAYGSGATRQQFAAAGRTLLAKVPQENRNGGRFPKSAFLIDLETNTVTCPGGQTTRHFTQGENGGKLFHFGAACGGCPLREQCTAARGGRQIRVHPQEAMLREARAYQAPPEGRTVLRQRVAVEHPDLSGLGQLGIGQARYLGRRKTRFQLLIAAAVANLRRIWNWEQEQAARGPAGDGRAGDPEGFRGPLAAIFANIMRRVQHVKSAIPASVTRPIPARLVA